MKSGNIHIVVNPAAGSGRAKKIAGYVYQSVKTFFGPEVELSFTQKMNDATLITRMAIMNESPLVIAVGGDGTINEVVNGFFTGRIPLNPDCQLGIISCGTGRGFANSLNFPKSMEKQVESLYNPGFTLVDIGSITCLDFSGETVQRLFVNECQAGIGSKVASAVGRNQKVLGGKISFGIAAALQALRFKSILLQLEFDNELRREYSLIGLVIGNGTECAGGMKLTPDAKLNDALFDVLLMHDMTIVQRLANLSKTYSGTHIPSPYFTIQRCKKLHVTSDHFHLLEADGELLGTSPFSVEILPAALKIKTAVNTYR